MRPKSAIAEISTGGTPHNHLTANLATTTGSRGLICWKRGFHDGCLEYEVVTAKGEILNCTPDNENQLLFQMLHGTFGTLGIITRLTFRLVPAKPYVKVTFEKFTSLQSYLTAIKSHHEQQDLDFMDGIIHSPELYVLCAWTFVYQAPYTHRYDWTRVYYLSTRDGPKTT